LALVIKEQTEIFLLDNDAFINKGNKQAAKRARVASLKAGKAKQYRAESMRVLTPPTARILTLFLFIGKTPSFNYEGVLSMILFLYNHIFYQTTVLTVTSSSYFSRSIVQIILRRLVITCGAIIAVSTIVFTNLAPTDTPIIIDPFPVVIS
jgi:hypothetical protein